MARGVPLRPARVGDADSAHVWTCGSPNARARPADRLARRTLRRQGQGTRASASQQVCAAGWHEPQPAARLRRRLARSRSQATRSSAPRGALFLSRPVVVNNFLSHAPASLNVLRARRKRAVSGAGLEPRARTFRTTATQALAALGVAHPCIGAGGVLTLVPTRLAGSPHIAALLERARGLAMCRRWSSWRAARGTAQTARSWTRYRAHEIALGECADLVGGRNVCARRVCVPAGAGVHVFDVYMLRAFVKKGAMNSHP